MSVRSIPDVERLAEEIVSRLTIEIEASGRHIHLCRADLEAAAQRTAALEQQLSALTLDRAVDRAMAGTEFSSKAARDFVRGRLTAAGLPVENGALTGAAELIEQMRQEDPGAFLQDRPKVEVTVAAKPVASGAGSALRKAFGI